MYIEYVRNQRAIDTLGDTDKKPDTNPERILNHSVSEFKPTKLVRVSDMQVVPGSSVKGHYWALSYSWNQSGELIHKGGEDYDRIDEGRHKITEYREIPGFEMRSPLGPPTVTDTDFDPETASIKCVTFEGLIQQICKDFDIDYIWYDQMCIDQSNHEQKMREIRQMHLIYANALCTVALVPELEFNIEDDMLSLANEVILLSTQWCKRMWTLEEAYVSKHILFLGHNVHHWGDIAYIWMVNTHFLHIPTKHKKWKACTVLWYARNRTSSKGHDRIFALANIIPELMDAITFSYNQPLYDLTLQFYNALAEKDPSILWFGAALHSDPEDRAMTARQEETRVSRSRKYIRTLIKFGRAVKTSTIPPNKALPSWAGADGIHITQFILDDKSMIVTPNYTIAGDCIRLTSKFITVRITSANAVEKHDGFDDPDKYRDTYRIHSQIPCKEYEAKDGDTYYFTEDGLPMTMIGDNRSGRYLTHEGNETKDLTFVATTSKTHHLYTFGFYTGIGLKATHMLPLIVEGKPAINTLSKPVYCGGWLSLTEECSECIILSEPMFRLDSKTDYSNRGYPVIIKHKDYYRSIGIFILPKYPDIYSLFQREKTFDIK